MKAFKTALISEDILNDKSQILPFMKFMENNEIFEHFFEDEEDEKILSNLNGKVGKASHGETFHFLALTNKFMQQQMDKKSRR